MKEKVMNMGQAQGQISGVKWANNQWKKAIDEIATQKKEEQAEE